MSTYPACPNCHYNRQQDLFSGAYFKIFQCTACDRKYCFKCPGSNDGHKCPGCGSQKHRHVGEVYLRT